ncbi:hypothetical protein HCN44_004676 [Aphidius gifuensis]|uniref:Uncharacterized protein n=1 Tax=Aphidius gifuensis TaxID=684658 RepID=A0A835CSP1_APHGI|nr:hypothetical protein HCN44_004676 [Aphidius gifuensis]
MYQPIQTVEKHKSCWIILSTILGSAAVASIVTWLLMKYGQSSVPFTTTANSTFDAKKDYILDFGFVNSDSNLCSTMGRWIIKKNGSAVDSAITTMICNGIMKPSAMGIGGGFLMTIYDRKNKQAYFLNAKDKAPLDAGENLSQIESLAIGVPGEVAGYWEAHQKYGKLTWSDLFEPNIKLCKIQVKNHLQTRPQLCETIKMIAEKGANEFYNGTLGEMLIEDLTKLGSLMTIEDLNNYRVEWIDLMKNGTPKNFARNIKDKIDDEITWNEPGIYGSAEGLLNDHATSHISVVAPNGDAVFVTSSLNSPSESHYISYQTGIILNCATDKVSNEFPSQESDDNNELKKQLPIVATIPLMEIESNVTINTINDNNDNIDSIDSSELNRTAMYLKARELCNENGFDYYTRCYECDEYERSLRSICLKCCEKSQMEPYPQGQLEICQCKFAKYPHIVAFLKSHERRSKHPNLSIIYSNITEPCVINCKYIIIMSNNDVTESQWDKTIEKIFSEKGNILTKDKSILRNNQDASFKYESTDSDDECCHKRQEADGASDAHEVFPETPLQPKSFQMDLRENPSNLKNGKKNETQETPFKSHEETCSCKICKIQRKHLHEKINDVWKWQEQGLKIRKYIRCVFNAAVESLSIPNLSTYQCDPNEYAELQKIVDELSLKNPHLLFLMLVIQAQEFVVELKIRIMEPLEDNNLARIAEVFLTRLLNGYDILISTAVRVSKLLKPLEERHLSNFNLTWEFFNKKLYQNYIYFYEPTIRNKLPSVVCQLRKPRKGKGYQILLERYLGFVDEMMRIAGLWPEQELLIDQYSAEKVAQIMKSDVIHTINWKINTTDEIILMDLKKQSHIPGFGITKNIANECFKKPKLQFKIAKKSLNIQNIRCMLDVWVERMYQIMACGTLGIDGLDSQSHLDLDYLQNSFYFSYQVASWLVLSRPTDNTNDSDIQCSKCTDLSWVSHLVVGGRNDFGECSHPILSQKSNSTTTTVSTSTSSSPIIDECKKLIEETNKKDCQCIQFHLSEWQGTTYRGLLPFPPCLCTLYVRYLPASVCPCLRENRDFMTLKKSTAESLADTEKNLCSVGINKNDKIKNIKNNINNKKNTNTISSSSSSSSSSCELSDSGSSHDDSCSTDSSTAHDNSRHCDCCYCEVPGHGVQQAAQVSRNYHEMRERLRQLLT